MPSPCAEALDIGCGTGAFSRLLAPRCKRVLALDLSPQMIQVARERSKPYDNIDFRVADATTWKFPAEQFDWLASAMALPVDVVLRLVKRGRLREPAEVRAAWDKHGRHNTYLTLSEIRTTCADILPGASVARHLLWRYSIIWNKEKPT